MKTRLYSLFILCLFTACQDYASLSKEAQPQAEQITYVLNNDAPIVSATSSSSNLTLPQNQVTLTASATDPNNDFLTYQWRKISGGNAQIVSQQSSSTNVTSLAQGNYIFEVEVTDSKGASTKAQVSIVVNPAIVVEPPKPAINEAGKVTLWRRQGTTGDSRWYYDTVIFLPKDYGSSPSKKYPLILSLHGLGGSVMNSAHTEIGGNKEGFIKQVWNNSLSNTFPAIVLAPDARPIGSTEQKWWNADQLGKLLQEALTKYQVDPKRIVVTGLSAGGEGTNQLIKKYKHLIAGAMPGAFNEDHFTKDPCALADIPVWSFGNNNDGVFQAYEWQKIEPVVKQCHNYIGKFKLNVYQNNCGHGCWDDHWKKPEVQEWLLNQSK